MVNGCNSINDSRIYACVGTNSGAGCRYDPLSRLLQRRDLALSASSASVVAAVGWIAKLQLLWV